MSSTTPSPDWKYHDFPLKAQIKIREVEAELDEIWPGWRQRLRFDKVDYDLKCRIKVCLKQHSLLTTRELLAPAPRYWDVIIVRDARDKNKCYAHPVIPQATSEKDSRHSVDDMKESAPEEAQGSPQRSAVTLSLPALAFELKAPLELLERLSEGAPESCFFDAEGHELEKYLREIIHMSRSQQ